MTLLPKGWAGRWASSPDNRLLFYRSCCAIRTCCRCVSSLFLTCYAHIICPTSNTKQLPKDRKARIQPRRRNLRRSLQSPRPSNRRNRRTQTHPSRGRRRRHPLHGPPRDLAPSRTNPRKYRRPKRLRPRRRQALPRLRIPRSGSQKGPRILQWPLGQNARQILPLPNDPGTGLLSCPWCYASRFKAAESSGEPRWSSQTRRFRVGTCLLPPHSPIDTRGGNAVVSSPRDIVGESNVRSSHGRLGYRYHLCRDGYQTSSVPR